MSSLPGKTFTASNRNRMGSNAVTAQAQGGGSKKAGFPYMVGRGYQIPMYFQKRNGIQNLTFLKKDAFKAMPSRPIGSMGMSSPNTYFNIPGTH